MSDANALRSEILEQVRAFRSVEHDKSDEVFITGKRELKHSSKC